MLVNELARHAGVEAHVVRFYTQEGLLHPERDPNNSYREYALSDVRRLRFIRRARWLGFTLRDIEAILNDVDNDVSPCGDVRETIKIRASENRQRIEDLKRLQSRMEDAVKAWERMPDRPPDHESLCHLIDAVARDEGSLT